MSPERLVAQRLVTVAFGVVVLLSGVTASAQDRRPARPYRGLFGPDERDAAQVLSVTGTAGIGYDTDVIAEQREHGLGGETNTSIRRTGDVFGLFAGGISYSDHGRRYDFGASLSSIARNYNRFAALSSHSASVSGLLRATRRTTLVGSETVTYQPFGTLFRFPALTDPGIGQIEPPPQDFGVIHGAYTSYSTAATATQELTKRSSVSASYSYQISSVSGFASRFNSQAGSARFTHKLTRDMGFHAGYGYTEARYFGGLDVYRGNSIDTGLDYSRDLSVTRRTHLSFSTGVTSIREHNYTRYIVNGSGVLSREIGRTWDAVAVYTRSVGFFETLRAPYFYDGISLGLYGLVSRRISVHTSAGATYGDVTLTTVTRNANRFSTAYGNAGCAFALSRNAALAADYMVYGYSLDDASVVTGGLLRPKLTRHSVTIALRAWLPIMERGRRSNVTR